MYIAVKNGDKKGVYLETEFDNKWRKPKISIKKFTKEQKEEALKWANEKEIKRHFNLDAFMKKYRSTKKISVKVKMLAKLEESNRKSIKKLLTKKEIDEYTKYTSALIERRFDCIKKNKECLDMLTAKKPNIAKIEEKYIDEDMSIPVYTIKAIINAREGIPFSVNDHKYSINAEKYYSICKRYWEIIYSRWDTDTGLLSKEDIINENYDEYHKNANKVKTIVETLEKGSFTRRKEIPFKDKQIEVTERADVDIYIRGTVDYTTESRQGYSVVVMNYKGKEKVQVLSKTNTTINKIIIESATEAVKTLKRPCNVHLYTHANVGIRTDRNSSKSTNSNLIYNFKKSIEKGNHTLKVTVSMENQKKLAKILKSNIKKEA